MRTGNRLLATVVILSALLKEIINELTVGDQLVDNIRRLLHRAQLLLAADLHEIVTKLEANIPV